MRPHSSSRKRWSRQVTSPDGSQSFASAVSPAPSAPTWSRWANALTSSRTKQPLQFTTRTAHRRHRTICVCINLACAPTFPAAPKALHHWIGLR